MSVFGWAVVRDGVIQIQTVSESRRAAIVNWLTVDCVIFISNLMSDDEINRLFAIEVHSNAGKSLRPARIELDFVKSGERNKMSNNATPNTIEDPTRKRPASEIARPAVLPAPDQPLVDIEKILAYAKKVAQDSSSTPQSPAAILPRELLRAYEKIARHRDMLSQMEISLVRARADLRRAVELLDARNVGNAKDMLESMDAALLRMRSDARKVIEA